jgi:hypothetical protein
MKAAFAAVLRALTHASATLAVMFFLGSSAFAQNLFDDEFDGTTLDSSLWTIVQNQGQIFVGGGLLQMQGGGDHHEINSIATFGQNTTATARIDPNARWQKFGYGVNSVGTPIGYYFDTYAIGVEGTDSNSVRVIVNSANTELMNQRIPVSWGQFHEFSITRSTSGVTFFIDGQQVAQFASTFSGALPVGVWDDRAFSMLTDYVRVVALGCQVKACGTGVTDNCVTVSGTGIGDT